MWTKEHEEYLAANYYKIPAREIVKNLNDMYNTSYTKNAVVAKASRIGVSLPSEERVTILKMTLKSRKVKEGKKAAPTCAPSRGVPFCKLSSGKCFWPLDNGKWCGHETKGHRNYCEHHQKKSLRKGDKIH